MATKNMGTMTPTKGHPSKLVENFNPNVQTPGPKPFSKSSSSSSSPVLKKSPPPSSSSFSFSKSSALKNPNNSPRNKFRQRKFVVVAKKNPKQNSHEEGAAGVTTVSFCKCKEKKSKCLCVAYENLRKSHEEFFKNRSNGEQKQEEEEEEAVDAEIVLEKENEKDCSALNDLGRANNTKKRDRLMEVAKVSVPESGGGSGKVMNLVKAFEKLMNLSDSKDEEQNKEEKETEEGNNGKVVMKWPMAGLQFSRDLKTDEKESCSSFCPPDSVLTSESLGLDQQASLSSSWDSSRISLSRRTSTGSGRSRRNSLESSSTQGGRRWKKKQMRVTSQKPFKLRTEQRGKLKEEEFVKKIQEMLTEEERQRIPIAQGLPLTTDEPECLLKPPVKEITRPIDLTLHSDVRAMDRAEFDHQVAEKLSLIEQYKIERERQKKLAEEEEVKRLRKELVPKAQPMPFFDRPFIPRRSVKNPTIPREPNFRVPHHKKIKCSLSSLNDMNPYFSYLDN